MSAYRQYMISIQCSIHTNIDICIHVMGGKPGILHDIQYHTGQDKTQLYNSVPFESSQIYAH